MDIRMPNMDGLAAARQILGSGKSRVLILTTFDADEYVYEALKMGASGFLLKDAPPEQLIAAVRCIAAGDALIDPSITRRLISRFAHAARPPERLPAQLKELTQRELDVLRLVARGLANAEIAAELVVEESTDQDPCQQDLDEAGASRPGPGRRGRLRVRVRRARRSRLASRP